MTSSPLRTTAVPRPHEIPGIAGKIGAEIAGVHADRVDRGAVFPREAIGALREARMMSALVPTSAGGSGAGLSHVALAVEALGAHCASTAMVYAMHQIQVASLVRHGKTPWLDAYTHLLCEKQFLLASATTEIGIGGDVRSSSCAVERTGGHFSLTKNAPVISYGVEADAILATARHNADSPPNDQVLALVTNDVSTLEMLSGWDTFGFRGTCSNGFMLRGEGNVEQIFADPYSDISSMTMLPTSHVVWASVWLGIANSAVDIARSYIRNEARKRPGHQPTAAVRLADLVAVHEQFRALVRAATADYERVMQCPAELSGLGFAIRMNSLKVSASTLVVDIVGRALTICGMAGYREDSDFSLGRLLRDAYGAALMVNNDRLLDANAQMLLVHKGNR